MMIVVPCGDNPTPIWGMGNAERLRRIAAAAKLGFGDVPPDGPLLLVNLGFVFDPPQRHSETARPVTHGSPDALRRFATGSGPIRRLYGPLGAQVIFGCAAIASGRVAFDTEIGEVPGAEAAQGDRGEGDHGEYGGREAVLRAGRGGHGLRVARPGRSVKGRERLGRSRSGAASLPGQSPALPRGATPIQVFRRGPTENPGSYRR